MSPEPAGAVDFDIMNTTGSPSRRTTAELASAFELTTSGGAAGITGVALDNRRVQPGDLFAALPGAHQHGATFATAAVAAGARAVLTDPAGRELLEDVDVPVLVAADVRAVLGRVSAWIYGEPATQLRTFGITGTNGKTTTSYLLEEIVRRAGRTTGLIGTVELKVGEERVPARLTTPEAPAIQALLARMQQSSVTDLVMEVSSHALAQHRVDGIVYDLVGFTNLTADHLDFHGGIENYFAAKAELFTPERARRGVVLVDDEWGQRMARQARIPVVTVSTRPDGPDADWQASITVGRADHTSFSLTHRDGHSLSTAIWMPGRFNVANAALALAMALESGLTAHTLHTVLGDGLRAHVPGRMEQVAATPRCIVDFAHNAEAMEQVLRALHPTTKGRLLVVFGATGERDKAKRAQMGRVAVAGADVVVVTDDDPHDEDPATIRRQVMAGALGAVPEAQRQGRTVDVFEAAPRAEAIRRTVHAAGPADTVLIAGRGHETLQEIAGVDHHLDDREEVRAALAERDADR